MPQVSELTNSNGVRRLSSLFLEMAKTPEEKKTAVYTLKDHDYKGLKSLYRLYMEACDPYEYTFAKQHLIDWRHWQLLCEAGWFKPYVERWRTELELYLKAAALSRIIQESASPTREGLSAAKFILEKGWGEKPTKGRPSKNDVRQAANKMAQEKSDIQDHIARLGLIKKAPDGITKS